MTPEDLTAYRAQNIKRLHARAVALIKALEGGWEHLDDEATHAITRLESAIDEYERLRDARVSV